MLIKLKLPEKVEIEETASDCRSFYQQAWNDCIDEISKLNQPLVRGMEIDIEAFAKDMFEVCVYPGLEKWEEQTNHIKTRWRTNAEIIRDNAHVWLKEKGK